MLVSEDKSPMTPAVIENGSAMVAAETGFSLALIAYKVDSGLQTGVRGSP